MPEWMSEVLDSFTVIVSPSVVYKAAAPPQGAPSGVSNVSWTTTTTVDLL